ncbi:MAG: triple tyrosine motif-containing protein [Marinoscillum sp.]
MSKILLHTCGVLLSIAVFAQKGDYPISDHQAGIKGLEYTTNDLVFDQYGLMYVATSAGLLRYDGAFWEFIETPSAVFSLDVAEDNRIYVGCIGSFGYLELTGDGLRYKTASPDSLASTRFKSTLVSGDSVIFLSEEVLYTYTPASRKTTRYTSPDKRPIKSIIQDKGEIFLNTQIASYLWSGQDFRESEVWMAGMEPPAKAVRSGTSQAVLLDQSGKLFYQKSGGFKPFKEVDVTVEDFQWINDTLLVASTRNNGCMVINTNSYKVEGMINYESGLPDDEIMSIEVDWNMGIWIAHQFGFSRVDPNAPVFCLSNQEGLEGNLITSVVFKGQVLLGTSSGLFRPRKDTLYEMSESVKRLTGSRSTPKTKTGQPKIREIKWVYERVSGINHKINVFRKHGNVLLVGTNGGLFEYNGKKVRKIVSDPVSEITSIPRSSEFLVIDNQKVSRYTNQDGDYTELPFGLDKTLVLTAYGDRKSLIWLVGSKQLMGAGLTYNGASILVEVDFPNDFLETPTISEMDKGLYFISNQGYFNYNYKNKALAQDSTMLRELGLPRHHLKDPDGGFWVYDGKMWKHVNQNGEILSYSYLSLFPDVRYIHRDGQDGSIYFINADNKFYKYLPEGNDNNGYQSNVFYKHLFAKSSYSGYQKQVRLGYDQNSLRAEVSQPDYLGLLKVEYQYMLDGMDKDWSAWSDNSTINLNFLPEGKYELKVRSRDIFGRVQTIDPIVLVIDPPYWQTTWFYFLEVVFFATLVLISTRLNQGKASNRFLTEGLTILTIVMIIETLQSAAGSYVQFATSPFIDFLINLCIALVIFPMEILLKKVIKSGKVPVNLKRAGSGAGG